MDRHDGAVQDVNLCPSNMIADAEMASMTNALTIKKSLWVSAMA
jgi:hypothetical protein